jgi:hypothetical protein
MSNIDKSPIFLQILEQLYKMSLKVVIISILITGKSLYFSK